MSKYFCFYFQNKLTLNCDFRKMTFAESRETEHFELIKVKEQEVSVLKKDLEKLKKSIKQKEQEIESLNKEILKIQDEKLDI